MPLTDVLIVSAVFGGLALAIISKLRQQNHPAYHYIKDLFKGKKQVDIPELTTEKIETKWF